MQRLITLALAGFSLASAHPHHDHFDEHKHEHATKSPCALNDGDTIVFSDQHDGDQKQVTIKGDFMTILPYANNETWSTTAFYDKAFCNATVDFNVPNKPSPPPCNLTATVYFMESPKSERGAIVYTDPTKTLVDDPTFPLNTWIMIK